MSTASPNAEPSAILGGRVRELVDSFRSTFGTRFDCWRREGRHWTRLSQETTIDDLAVPLDKLAATSQPQLFEGQDASLAIPFVDEEGANLVAVGTLETQEPHRTVALAQVLVCSFDQRQQIEQLQRQVAACNIQISHDFEELTFLRTVATHLDMAGVSVPFAEFAEVILPLMRRSVRAETLVLVGASRDGIAPDLLPLISVGEAGVSEEICLRLIQQFGQPDMKPLILNDVASRDDSGQFDGIDSLILVRVARDEPLGWLMAINRRRDTASHGDQIAPEFGTAEAGVVCTTATILATHARNVELFRENENALVSLVRSLVNAIEARDSYTCGHSERVALFAMRLARARGLAADDCERIYLSGLLHDVGKIGIPDTALSKPGKLNADELAEIQAHPDLGWQILQESEHLKHILPGVVHHHERVDGAGYPDRLAGNDIPLDARILAVADAYDAMTSNRPYRQAIGQERAEAILQAGAGSQWDPDLIGIFLRIMPEIIKFRQNYQRPAPPLRKPPADADG